MRRKGFTLIELLIVIAILGVLGAILFVTIGGSPQASARDARRMADIRNLQQVVELYAIQEGSFPGNNMDNGRISANCSTDFRNDLISKGYLAEVPTDPKDDGNCGTSGTYFYAWDTNHCGCDPVISINKFETQEAIDDFGQQATSCGGNMNIDNAEYNFCFAD